MYTNYIAQNQRKHRLRSASPRGPAGQACLAPRAGPACPRSLAAPWCPLGPGGRPDPSFEDKLELEVVQGKTIHKNFTVTHS